MKPELRNRLLALGAVAVAGLAIAGVSLSQMGDNLVYYWTPKELLAQGTRAYGPTIRLGGVVVPGSIEWNAAHTELRFKVADDPKPGATQVSVFSREIPPQMFRDGIGVIVEGNWDKAHVFQTERLMVNHSNEYRAPKDGEKPSESTLSQAPGTR